MYRGQKKYRVLCPRLKAGECCIYLLGLTDGRVKVGRTQSPRKRVLLHRRHNGAIGLSIEWAHFFGPYFGVPRSYWLEEQCRVELRKVGRQIGRTEVYTGVNKPGAIAACRVAIQRGINGKATQTSLESRLVIG